jgi:hypothetical protein
MDKLLLHNQNWNNIEKLAVKENDKLIIFININNLNTFNTITDLFGRQIGSMDDMRYYFTEDKQYVSLYLHKDRNGDPSQGWTGTKEIDLHADIIKVLNNEFYSNIYPAAIKCIIDARHISNINTDQRIILHDTN